MGLIDVLILIFAISFVVGVTAVNLIKKHTPQTSRGSGAVNDVSFSV